MNQLQSNIILDKKNFIIKFVTKHRREIFLFLLISQNTENSCISNFAQAIERYLKFYEAGNSGIISVTVKILHRLKFEL